MLNGQRPELNQVSKMSLSCTKLSASAPHSLHPDGPSASALTVMWPSAQYHAGIRCPHQSWRLTFQSRISVSQCSHVFSKCAGTMRVFPERVAASAFSASGLVRMNHCVRRRGSRMSLLRWQRAGFAVCGFTETRRPSASSAATIALRAANRSIPANGFGASATMCAASSKIVGAGRL